MKSNSCEKTKAHDNKQEVNILSESENIVPEKYNAEDWIRNYEEIIEEIISYKKNKESIRDLFKSEYFSWIKKNNIPIFSLEREYIIKGIARIPKELITEVSYRHNVKSIIKKGSHIKCLLNEIPDIEFSSYMINRYPDIKFSKVLDFYRIGVNILQPNDSKKYFFFFLGIATGAIHILPEKLIKSYKWLEVSHNYIFFVALFLALLFGLWIGIEWYYFHKHIKEKKDFIIRILKIISVLQERNG